MIIQSRRSFLGGLFSAIAAPAIVRIQNIMPVRAIIAPVIDCDDILTRFRKEIVVEYIRKNFFSPYIPSPHIHSGTALL